MSKKSSVDKEMKKLLKELDEKLHEMLPGVVACLLIKLDKLDNRVAKMRISLWALTFLVIMLIVSFILEGII